MTRKKLLWIVFIASIILVCFIVFVVCRKSDDSFDSSCPIQNTVSPIIKLKGEERVELFISTPYIEKGYHAEDSLGRDLSGKVIVSGHVNVMKAGSYLLTYKVNDCYGNQTVATRTVMVKEKQLSYRESYQNIDNKVNGWWSGNKKDGTRPAGGANEEELKKYDAFFMGPDEKKVYFTFDEGSNDTYIEQILDVLKKHDVKATFFLCGHYIESNPDIIKRMSDEGHSVGNHTYHHRQMPMYATTDGYLEYVKELTLVEEAYQKITGKPLDKVYREPKGEWSYRSLQIAKDLGYRSYFWSASYLDYEEDLSGEVATEKMKQLVHNGAIYLLHPKNKGNYEGLESFIQYLKGQGYSFGLVRDIHA